jgi:hypothetical protein
MNLLKSDNLSNALSDAYNFLRDSQLNFIIMGTTTLSDTLDEYIFYMFRAYDMYMDRITEHDFNSENVFAEHVSNFGKIMRGDNINSKEKTLIINFYDELINYADSILGSKYYLGKKFNEYETELIERTSFTREIKNKCTIKNILIYVPKEIFNKEEFIGYSFDYSHTKLIGIINETDSYYKIEFKNDNKNFYFCHIYDIKYCCKQIVSFDIDYELSSDTRLIIVFDEI